MQCKGRAVEIFKERCSGFSYFNIWLHADTSHSFSLAPGFKHRATYIPQGFFQGMQHQAQGDFKGDIIIFSQELDSC